MGNQCTKGSAGALLAASDLDAIKNKAKDAVEKKKQEAIDAAEAK